MSESAISISDLHFSYGKSSIYRVLKERVDGQVQGGVYRLPIDPACAVMRGVGSYGRTTSESLWMKGRR